MRRLSIIDLEGGAQPIWNEDETIGVVFNGEIYNYVELRARTHRRAATSSARRPTPRCWCISTSSYGDAMFAQLRGMFAFALLDTNTQTACSSRAITSGRSRSITSRTADASPLPRS